MSDLERHRRVEHNPIKTTVEPAKMSNLSNLSPSHKDMKRWAKAHRTEIAASSSSLLASVVAYPLDSVKTRMQAFDFAKFTECVRHTYLTEGTKGFWRGFLAPLASTTMVRTINFSIYQKVKYKLSAAIGQVAGMDEPLKVVNTPGSVPTFATVACFGIAGATAGGCVSVLACPFELTKVAAQISQLMAQSDTSEAKDSVRGSYQQKGIFKTAKNIVLHRGYVGLYSGFHLHLFRDTLGTSVYFMAYESGKQLLVKFQGSNSPTSPLSVALAGGFCGMVSWAATYAIDTAKTNYQRGCLENAKGEPFQPPKIQFFSRGQYRGLGVSMARSCIMNMVFFSGFEYVKKRINKLEDPLD